MGWGRILLSIFLVTSAQRNHNSGINSSTTTKTKELQTHTHTNRLSKMKIKAFRLEVSSINTYGFEDPNCTVPSQLKKKAGLEGKVKASGRRRS